MTDIELASAALERPNGASPPEPESRRVTVTPEMATEWLNRNTRNRPLRDDYVTTLTGAILRGEWKLNGDAIRFSTAYEILDGQHRLWALVMAAEKDPDVTIETFVVFNLPPETQDTMDAGRRRLVSDVLKMHGEVNTNILAATMQRIHTWRIGEKAIRRPHGYTLTSQQALAMIQAEPNIRDAVRVSNRIHQQAGGTGISKSVVAACLYVFHQIDEEDSLLFWRQVGTGEGLHRYMPTFELRRAIQSNKGKRKVSSQVMHALVIKAWNAFRDGREIKVLSWKGSEKWPETAQ